MAFSSSPFWRDYAQGLITDPAEFKLRLHDLRASHYLPDRFTSFRDVPSDLVIPGLLSDAALLSLHERADWSHAGNELREFSARYIEAARRLFVPLWVRHADHTCVNIAHWYPVLGQRELHFLQSLARQTVQRHNLPIYSDKPLTFLVRRPTTASPEQPPTRRTPRKLRRDLSLVL